MKIKPVRPPHRQDRAIAQEILEVIEKGNAGSFFKDARDGTIVRMTTGERPIKVHYNGPAGGIMRELIDSGKVAVATTPQAYADDRTGYRIGKPASRTPQMS